MKKDDITITNLYNEPKRKLSLLRLLIAVATAGLLCYGLTTAWQAYAEFLDRSADGTWFAPYVDVTSTPAYPFEQLTINGTQNAMLAFIVASPDKPCTPTWGGAYTLDEASANLDLDRRIARFRQQEGHLAISFGGLLNDELALVCTDHDKLLTAYQSVVDRYDINTIDLDLEGEGLANREAMARRAAVIAELQKQRANDHKKLRVWLTLPVTTHGLTEIGTNAVADFLAAGVDLAGVNAMTMNFGGTRGEGQSMGEASKEALAETHRQVGILYRQAGKNISSGSLWAKIAATPMIGQNDLAGEVFNLQDAAILNQFVSSKGSARLSMWSANRDIQCSENYVNVNVVSDSCSGAEQVRFAFAQALGQGLNAKISQTGKEITDENEPTSEPKIDTPGETPYQIWQETGTYLEGTKVVWRQNVYQAKWWTQGDVPDDPVLQIWQTPWKLVGPVLPGEKPVPPTTLPAGTYPTWDGTATYDAGQRVLVNGVPYQAKWWTQGDSPSAAFANPNSSPWLPLTDDQINRVKAEIKNRN